MKAQLQGAAAGGSGVGVVAVIAESVRSYFDAERVAAAEAARQAAEAAAEAARQAVDAAMQESYLELIQKMAEQCGGG